MKKLLYFLILMVGVLILIAFVKRSEPKNEIAVLEIKGVLSKSLPYELQIEKAQKDSNIKALVLRVDSPGGAVGTAQEIYRALEIFKQTKKPLVVSMGNVAASGGYYISVPADYIYANPGTITGSIGVIVEHFNVQKLLEKIGISQSDIKSGKFKDILSPFRKMTKEEKEYVQGLINNTYNQFIDAILKYRHINKNTLLANADGRVFTGLEAQKLGLVDGIGNLEDAISKAKALAHLKHAKVVYLGEEKNFLEKLLNSKTYFISDVKDLLDSPLSLMYIINF